MSTTTENLGLFKPELTDPADITKFNRNWDILDECIVSDKVTVLTSKDDLNTVTKTGFYKFDDLDLPLNAPFLCGHMRVYCDSFSNGIYEVALVYQEVVTVDAAVDSQNLVARRTLYVTPTLCETSDWQFENPELRIGVEYRTPERYNSHPVFKILKDDGIVHKYIKSAHFGSDEPDGFIQEITPMTYGTEDLTAGSSPLTTGCLYFVYE